MLKLKTPLLAGLAVLVSLPAYSAPGRGQTDSRPKLYISRVNRPPVIEDFLDMKPNGALRGKMSKVEPFIQRHPRDGEASTEHTQAYVGYDDKNLYIVFVCFASDMNRVRARLVEREKIWEDDVVRVEVDTFHDQRRAYSFATNPLGVQWDGLWAEGQGWDGSFDTFWHSWGRLTDKGYVVQITVPFRSLRFSSAPVQTWGILFSRRIPYRNEASNWPHISNRVEGRLNQAATLHGLENISPTRNVQLTPFGFFRSFRSLDNRDPARPHFVTERFEPDAGLDAKFVFQDSFALDVALNPDFSQVESDEPQVTVNRRFEVFFPEKRPFFLENSGFFETPINLFFSRRIADPSFGLRLTGKKGPYAIGALVADDESPGKAVLPGDPLFGKRARFGVLRVNRDIFQQSTVGMIYTDRDFNGGYNRVSGIDGRLKLSPNWVASFQGVTSSTLSPDGSYLAGPAYDAHLSHRGRQFRYGVDFRDRSPGFRTEPGFVRRSDIRYVRQFASYRFRPEGKYLLSWGPRLYKSATWDHSGNRLDWRINPVMIWEFPGQSYLSLYYNSGRERLRPQDFEGLAQNLDFSRDRKGFSFRTRYLPQVGLHGGYSLSTQINFVPPEGEFPMSADVTRGNFGLTLRPATQLRVDNTYVLERLIEMAPREASIFNNHILRSKWNWQFNRELSLRLIFQYDTLLANPKLTRLESSKNFNADFLLTYLLTPGTALYAGYNGNVQNLALIPTAAGTQVVRTDRFLHDSGQFFLKVSYLFQF